MSKGIVIAVRAVVETKPEFADWLSLDYCTKTLKSKTAHVNVGNLVGISRRLFVRRLN